MSNSLYQIGEYHFQVPTIVAPMAGVTDRPFRSLCRHFGAGLAVSEMLTSDHRLWHSRKSRQRMDHTGEVGPISVQIAGGDAAMLAQAAALNAEHGAQIIDINMGCPAKKVCNKAAGSALLKDEALVTEIIQAVVQAVDVPVTLKIRTGWDREQQNALTIAKIAQDNGIAALAIHGRTRACKFQGQAEYDKIAEVKQQLSIPVFANGDITSALKAKQVLDYTRADAVMIGRGAQGNPWIFREINHYLETGDLLPAPTHTEQQQITLQHLRQLHEFYGELSGMRIARKHMAWYIKDKSFSYVFNRIDSCQQQEDLLTSYFENNKLRTFEHEH